MTIAEILNSVKFVVEPDGHQSAVMVDVEIWEQIVTLLEDAEDAEEIKKARTIKEVTIPWNTAKKELNLGE
ncbi:MAG: hypothetical protein AB1846_15510 [Chloroflexota bacterium]